jgi:Holliday junction resolvase RusA-like endonuclease
MILNLDVKPLSVNQCWQGRRFKTKAYKQYEKALLQLLPNLQFNFKGDISVEIIFGFSNTTSDIDNPLKPILDILQKKYKFNDRCIYNLTVKKEITNKKEEFIKIKITDHNERNTKTNN